MSYECFNFKVRKRATIIINLLKIIKLIGIRLGILVPIIIIGMYDELKTGR